MFTPRIRAALLVVSASVGLGACAYGPYGGTGVSVGYSSGYGGYGYGSPYYGAGYGYGSPYYGGIGYGSPYYGYGRGFGVPLSYYGWYNNYYYPGIGYYVYNRDGRRYRWSDAQRRYWQSRRTSTSVQPQENWSDFRRDRIQRSSVARPTRVVRTTSQPSTNERRVARAAERSERQAARAERRTATSRKSERRRRVDD